MSGMTFEQLAEYQKRQQAADDAQQKATGVETVRKGGGYTSAPVNENSVQLEKPIHDDLNYYTPGTVRNIKEGTSGADEYLLGDNAYAQIQALKKEWEAASAAGDTARAQAAHDAAEAIRAKAGYSGGVDGGGYDVLPRSASAAQRVPVSASGAGVTSGGSPQKSLLDKWQQAAIDQNNARVDYAVQQAVTELERALADSQNQFKEQAEAVAKDEMQALDNSALYAEARGDKGGIGQSQYNEIQAAAAQNRLAVQQAQTKLSTDTARQVADLRAQGEFEKADKLLEITQSYLSQLVSLEQWAAEFGLSQQQFRESVRQWEAEFALATRQYNDGLAADQNSQYADMGSALLSAGIMPSSDQLTAMGMTESQAQEYLMRLQLEQAAGKSAGGGSGGGTGGSSGGDAVMSLTTAKQAAGKGVFSEGVLSVLRANGYDDQMLSAIYGYKPEGTQPAAPAAGDDLAEVRSKLASYMVNATASEQEIWLLLDGSGLSDEDKLKLAAEFGL